MRYTLSLFQYIKISAQKKNPKNLKLTHLELDTPEKNLKYFYKMCYCIPSDLENKY